MTLRRPVIAAAGLVLLLALALILAIGGQDQLGSKASADPPSPSPFSILEDGDAPSQTVLDSVPAEWVAAYDLDLEEALSEEADSGPEVVVVPGDDHVCIATEIVAGCGTWVDAELGKLALVEACAPDLDPGTVRVTGLLPDDASVAAITRPPSAAVNVSAPLNVYSELVEGDPDEITSSGLTVPATVPWTPDESLSTCDTEEEEPDQYSDPED